MNGITAIGLVASICTGVSLLPQLIKIYKEKKPAAISYPMLVILLMGLAFWIWYGVKKEDWIIIISNSFSLLLNLGIFFLNSFYRRQSGPSH